MPNRHPRTTEDSAPGSFPRKEPEGIPGLGCDLPDLGAEGFRTLFRSMSEACAIQEILLDDRGEPLDSRFLDVNPAFERLVGFSRSELAGRAASEALPEGPFWGPRFGPVALQGTPLREEGFWERAGLPYRLQAVSPSRGRFAVLFSTLPPPREARTGDGYRAALEAVNDIFQGALARETVEEVAATCLDVACRLTGSALGVVGLVNPSGTLRAVALHFEGGRIMGLTPEEAQRRMGAIPGGGFWREVLQARHCLSGPAPASMAGHAVPLKRLLGVPLLQGDQALGFIGLANKDVDYTPADHGMMENLSGAFVEAMGRKRSEIAVKRLNVDLESRGAGMRAAMEELDSFSYSVSHDLRAPLRHLIGFTELLQKEAQGRLEGKAAHYMEAVLASSRAMGNLIEGLLAYSQSSRSTIQKKHVDLAELVRDVVRALEPDCRGRSVAWEVAPLPVVWADPALLRSALTNLLSNALKFTRNRERALIRIGAEEKETETVISVSDNGAGFNPRYAHRLFGLYQRLHPSMQFEGSGIGLANVRRIILRHGGRVWAEGAPDAGATFYFALPSPRGAQGPGGTGD